MKYPHLLLVAALASACTGSIDQVSGPNGTGGDGQTGGADGNDPNNPGGGGGGGDEPVDLGDARQPLCDASAKDKRGPRVLRRLTKDEYEISVRSVFGFDAATYSGSDLPPDAAARNGMTNQADLLVVGDAVAERVLSSAERAADLVVSDAHLTRILPCAGSGDDACANTFLDTVAKRLYRRPLTSEERARYLELRDTVGEEGGEFKDFVKWSTVAMLSSPNMLYRSELGTEQGDGSYALDGFERATALAFTFTGAPPDDALLAAAERGDLDSAEGVKAATRAMVYDEAGNVKDSFKATFRRFVGQWLGLASFENRDKDTTVFTDWTPEVRASMRKELDAFVESVVFDDKGGIAELLTAPYTMLNARLAQFYGYGTAAGETFEKTIRPEGWGVGIFSQAAFLALKSTNRQTSPTQRGHAIRDKILCNVIPPPPPAVGLLPEPTESNTTRERYEDLHANNASCAGCHRAMDPIGFTFEHLDAVGRYRAQENGFEIDDSGLIVAMREGEKDVTVEGPTALADELVNREAAGACFGAFFAAFSFGFDQDDSACLVSTPREKLAAGDLSLLDFLTELTTAPHFTTRVD